MGTLQWFLPSQFPNVSSLVSLENDCDANGRLLLYVPNWSSGPIQFGRFIPSLQEWRVEGSNNAATEYVALWSQVPHPKRDDLKRMVNNG
jgi:hypothetical protein